MRGMPGGSGAEGADRPGVGEDARQDPRPVAVTGAGGRLGSALLRALTTTEHGAPAVAWRRPEYDLDDARSGERLVARDAPGVVLHAAAWTDVDGCARDPGLAMRRNADAVEGLARACRSAGAGLVMISTNEVFDGERSDGRGYVESDRTGPRNPYGASKLAGEEAARAAFGERDGLWIVRTAWLFGPPGGDFPDRIIAAADRLPAGEALPVVSDEVGSPTATGELARAILALVARTPGGTWHLACSGTASRLEWARAVLDVTRPGLPARPISRHEFVRASDPPPWGVLDSARAAALGIRLRHWRDQLADDLRARTGAGPERATLQEGTSWAGSPAPAGAGAGAEDPAPRSSRGDD